MSSIISTNPTDSFSRESFVSLPIAYLGSRHKESDKEGDIQMQRAAQAVDRLDVLSIPGRVDQFELSQIDDPEMLRSYIEGREKIDGTNRKWQIAKIVAGGAGSAAAIIASFVAGGWVLLGITTGLGALGAIASRFMSSKIRDPRAIANIKAFDEKVAEMLEKLDRPVLSRPHWVDYDEYVQLSPEHQRAYERAVEEIVSHNESSKSKSYWASFASKVSGYLGLGLPLVAEGIPGVAWVSRFLSVAGRIGGTFLSWSYDNAVVTTKEIDDLVPFTPETPEG